MPARIGVAIGSGIGGIGLIEEAAHTLRDRGPRRMSPFFVPSTIVNMIAGHLSIHERLTWTKHRYFNSMYYRFA